MDEQIKLQSLSDQLYEYLSHSIIEGIIKPGEKLTEKDLSQKFGISRAPVRECFRILESEGLIFIHPRKGTFVRVLSHKDIEDAFPVRATLESLAAKLAVPNITEEDIRNLIDLVVKMDQAISNKDIRSFIHINFAFHSLFIKASKNPILEKTLKNLGKGIWLRFAYLYYQSPKWLDFSNEFHKQIIRAFQERNIKGVQGLIEEHIEHAKQELLNLL